MPIIKVEMLTGRSKEQKRALVRELTKAFVDTAGGKPEGIHIVIQDIEKDNWSSGGKLYSDKLPD